MSCTAPADAYLHARLAGAIESELHWSAAALGCDGMRRPDGRGLRVTFSGPLNEEHLTLVFGIPRLAEGASGRAVPVNVTLIREGKSVYGTRGVDRCTLDEVHQARLPQATPDAPHRWRIEARGFCLEPARAVQGSDAILLARFEFRGSLTWEPSTSGAPAPR